MHLSKQRISPATINQACSALRFFFKITLDRPYLVRHLAPVQRPRKMPAVLSQDEVARLIEAAPSLKYRAALSVGYGAGLRVSEIAKLKVSDIDSGRMTLRVERGKGQRERYVMLSPQLLTILREWWRAARPPVWLFPGQNPINPVTERQINRAMQAAAKAAGILKARVATHPEAQLRDAPARAGRRHSRDPGLARNRHILPATTRSRDGSTIRFILDAARQCSSSSNSPIAGLIWSLFLSPTERSLVSSPG